jgi:predicted nucleic acid-binding protein
MNLYAESSAVLAWLFGEPAEERVRAILAGARQVVASDLTVIECQRALVRATANGRISEAKAADERARLAKAVVSWNLLRLDAEVNERACRPFPAEPLRTLDALHLASALTARAALPSLAILSLDSRVRESGGELGFPLLPEAI